MLGIGVSVAALSVAAGFWKAILQCGNLRFFEKNRSIPFSEPQGPIYYSDRRTRGGSSSCNAKDDREQNDQNEKNHDGRWQDESLCYHLSLSVGRPLAVNFGFRSAAEKFEKLFDGSLTAKRLLIEWVALDWGECPGVNHLTLFVIESCKDIWQSGKARVASAREKLNLVKKSNFSRALGRYIEYMKLLNRIWNDSG